MRQVFAQPDSITDKPFHFCPGCHHGIIHRLVGECIDSFDLKEKTIGVASVGCSVFLYDYFAVDVIEAPHGRAAAVATGVKRARPDHFVFTYQGDGDFAAIGTAEGMHAANRGENLTVIFVNNMIYGMTGGQMAPTTMPGEITTTSPYGREPASAGYPIRMSEVLAQLPGANFVARGMVTDPKNLMRTKKLIRRAFEVQINREGFGFVEILSSCPTNWKLSTSEATKKVRDTMSSYFPMGIFKGKLE